MSELRRALLDVAFGFVLLLSLCFSFVGCSWLNGPDTAELDQAAAGVFFAAEVVHVADDACADTVKVFRESGKLEASAEIGKACSLALGDAKNALETAAGLIDAGKAWALEDVACAIVNTADGVFKLRPILLRHGVKLPPKVDRFVSFASVFTGACRSSR